MSETETSGSFRQTWIAVVVALLAASSVVGYLTLREAFAPRTVATGLITRTWISQDDQGGDSAYWLELATQTTTLRGYMVPDAFPGTKAEWAALEGHRVLLTIHESSLIPGLTQPLWEIDSLMLLD